MKVIRIIEDKDSFTIELEDGATFMHKAQRHPKPVGEYDPEELIFALCERFTETLKDIYHAPAYARETVRQMLGVEDVPKPDSSDQPSSSTMSTSDSQWTPEEMEKFMRSVTNQMTMPIPETIWLVSSGFPRTDGLLGRVYLDHFMALQSKGDGEVVVELRLQSTSTPQPEGDVR